MNPKATAREWFTVKPPEVTFDYTYDAFVMQILSVVSSPKFIPMTPDLSTTLFDVRNPKTMQIIGPKLTEGEIMAGPLREAYMKWKLNRE